MGHGMRVCLIQFIKCGKNCGELKAAERFSDLMDVHVLGAGFTWQSEHLEKDIAIAREAWRFAVETIAGDLHAVVILDELTYLVKYGMVPEAEVLKALAGRPARMHIVVTGRDASPGLIELADIVTEMRAVKHPYDDGMRAQRGVEF